MNELIIINSDLAICDINALNLSYMAYSRLEENVNCVCRFDSLSHEKKIETELQSQQC